MTGLEFNSPTGPRKLVTCMLTGLGLKKKYWLRPDKERGGDKGVASGCKSLIPNKSVICN